MPTREHEEFERVTAEVTRRQRRSASRAKPISDAVNRLLARRGYAQLQSSQEWETVWREAVGPRMAEHSRAGRIRSGVLEILVRNSAVLQELTFQKKRVLSQLRKLIANDKIRDLRFRVGDLE